MYISCMIIRVRKNYFSLKYLTIYLCKGHKNVSVVCEHKF